MTSWQVGNAAARAVVAPKPGSHRKGAALGSGGQKRKGLQGRGPTPPAEDRKGHPAQRRPGALTLRPGAGGAPVASDSRWTGRPDRAAALLVLEGPRRWPDGRRLLGVRLSVRRGLMPNAPEIVAGRNPVVEALRAGIPASALYVANGIEVDERVREAMKLANQLRVPLLDAERIELDRFAQGAVHQGLVLQVPPFDYAHPDELLDRAFSLGVPLLVALDGVTDPRNLGAVVRSVGAFGGHGVLVPERRSAGMTASAWKARPVPLRACRWRGRRT